VSNALGTPEAQHGVVVLLVQTGAPDVDTLNEIKKLREAAAGKVT